MKRIFASVCRDFEAKLVEFNGSDDHVHLLIEYPPKVPVSKLTNSLKGVSSRMMVVGPGVGIYQACGAKSTSYIELL